MMTRRDFLDKLTLAVNSKTLYVVGGFGAPASEKNKKRYANNHDYNKKIAETIYAQPADCFFFDCCGLVKGVLWGWNADKTLTYGGAVYKSNGVPDIGTESLIAACSEVSEDFGKIEPGELLWQQGHVGIYAGDGVAIESTGLWKDGVQFVPLSKRTGKYEWKKHGKLPWVDYAAEPKFEIGQLVRFTGYVYYGSPTSTSPWATSPCLAVVTGYDNKGPHAYKIKGQTGGLNGYVDEATLAAYHGETYTEPTTMTSVALPIIAHGNKGEAVRTLKILLNAHGAKLTVDDKFDEAAEKAVVAFQKAAKLDATGEVDAKTWKKILRG